jgi:GT2 family glycosyltransferase
MVDDNIFVLNTDDISAASPDGTLWGNRMSAYSQYDADDVPLCSICVNGYNRLEKTKRSVECILKYTTNVNYELILVDNGSSDGTLDFFKSVQSDHTRIIRVTKNIGSVYWLNTAVSLAKGKFIVIVSNDVYVTSDWLNNLMKCFESDPRIAMAQPMSNNVSNLQMENLGGWQNFDEMQAAAEKFNKSDPNKWEERQRLITILNIFRRDVLDSVGLMDSAYVHDFSEDDLCVRMRRMGYKLMLCKDTWVCHDHDFRHMEDKDPTLLRKSIDSGRAIYREKYHGIDPWDDIVNFETQLLSALDKWKAPQGEITSLCVDVRCGTPVLEIRNHMRRRGRTEVKSWAFTTQAKYFLDLQTTDAETTCDRIDYIQSHYADESFDIVILGEPLNTYPTPITLLQRLYNFLKRGGMLMFKLRNTSDYNAMMRTAGLGGSNDDDYPCVMGNEEVSDVLKWFGGRSINIGYERYKLHQQDINTITNWVRKINPNCDDQVLYKLLTKDFLFSVVKG